MEGILIFISKKLYHGKKTPNLRIVKGRFDALPCNVLVVDICIVIVIWESQLTKEKKFPCLYCKTTITYIEATDTNGCHTHPKQDTRMPGTDKQPQRLPSTYKMCKKGICLEPMESTSTRSDHLERCVTDMPDRGLQDDAPGMARPRTLLPSDPKIKFSPEVR